MSEPLPYRRHDLLDVHPAAWNACLATRPDLAGMPHLADWATHGRPVIVRRFLPDEAPDLVPAGLPLPPADGKRRIALLLHPADVRPRAPVTLAAAQGTAPAAWRPTIAAMRSLGADHDAAPRVFGSLLWQALTGLPYLSPGSDLDLLWDFPNIPPRGFLDRLAAIEAAAPMRLDGEILLPDGAGLHWRELQSGAPSVLAKSVTAVALRPRPRSATP